MEFYKAKVADIMRCKQRDEQFVQQFENDFVSLANIFGYRNYNLIRRTIPLLANSWYYYLTSLDNIQTLGEEYTGTLRVYSNKIPNKSLQLLWLALYIGGESMYDRLLQHLKNNISTSTSLSTRAQRDLLRFLIFMEDNKIIFQRLHHSFFYINGIYYNIANRITGIKYVLVRQWLQDNSSTGSFKLLGKMTLVYLLYFLIQQGLLLKNQEPTILENIISTASSNSYSYSKLCSLCADVRKNTSSTPCGHLFCWECIHDSLKYQQFCPLCREIVDPCRIVILQNYM